MLLGGPAASAVAANPVAVENAKPGDAYWTAWKSLAPAATIEGYASRSSVEPGESLQLHVNSPSSTYRVEIDRLGWYGGAGGRRVLCLPSCGGARPPVQQTTAPLTNPARGWLGANWSVTETVPVGADYWASGYYLAMFVVTSGPDAGKAAWYPIVVRPPAGEAGDLLVQVPTNTWQAYNPWPGPATGRSLYEFNSAGGVAATRVSFNRPLTIRAEIGSYYQDPVFSREIQAVRFLEREGYDVAYWALIYVVALAEYGAAGFPEADEATVGGFVNAYLVQASGQAAALAGNLAPLPGSGLPVYDVAGAARRAAKEIGP